MLAPDLPGHGETGIRPVTFEATVAALAAWMESLPAPLPLLGYSQGARIALLLALEHPELASHLILVSGSSGISSDPVRARRRGLDDNIAAEIEAFGVDQFLDRWLTQPLTSTAAVSSTVAAWDRTVRSENTAAGLSAALRGLGQGAYPYVGDRLVELPMPLLAVAGGRDQKYRALAVEMASEAPMGRAVILEAAGHNVVLEEPHALADAVETFLTATSGN